MVLCRWIGLIRIIVMHYKRYEPASSAADHSTCAWFMWARNTFCRPEVAISDVMFSCNMLLMGHAKREV